MDSNLDTDILQICRTCRNEITTSSPFTYLDYTPGNTYLTIKQKFNYCIPEIDLSITSNAIVCSKCADIIKYFYEFKKICMQDACMDSNLDTDILQICRTCRNEITSSSSFTYLDYTPGNTYLTINQKFNYCIPEINLSITSNALVCSKCTDIIKYFYEFKKICIQSELQINKYIQQTQNTGDVNLIEIFRFHQLHNTNFDRNFKIEDFEVTEDLVCDINALNEVDECTESNERTYLLSLEKVDTQFVLFNTSEIIDYNLSKAEKNAETRINNIPQNCFPKISEYRNTSNHNLSKTDVYYYQCYTCGHKVENKSKLILHLKCHKKHVHYNKYHCRQKKKHMQVHTRKAPFSCSVCKLQCSTKNVLKQHIRIHTGEKPFSCSVCEYQCNQKSSLKRHIRIHTGEKPFSCSICEYQCNRKGVLKQHIRIHTGEKPFACSICEYQCNRKGVLKQHIQIHTGEKPFTCSICEYQCSRKGVLKQHIQIHTGEKPFSCSICEYQCNRKGVLKQHIRIHTGEKPFACSICEYQCSRKDVLKQHIRIHTGEKPFACSICEYQCSRQNVLKQHIRIHTGEKPFSSRGKPRGKFGVQVLGSLEVVLAQSG